MFSSVSPVIVLVNDEYFKCFPIDIVDFLYFDHFRIISNPYKTNYDHLTTLDEYGLRSYIIGILPLMHLYHKDLKDTIENLVPYIIDCVILSIAICGLITFNIHNFLSVYQKKIVCKMLEGVSFISSLDIYLSVLMISYAISILLAVFYLQIIQALSIKAVSWLVMFVIVSIDFIISVSVCRRKYHQGYISIVKGAD
jgi:hypothetical protein